MTISQISFLRREFGFGFSIPIVCVPFGNFQKALNPIYCSTKLYVITPETLTGCPESSVGEKRACRAAETAACCKSGWPETAEAETTRPDSSTRICTVTVPEARAAFAMGG